MNNKKYQPPIYMTILAIVFMLLNSTSVYAIECVKYIRQNYTQYSTMTGNANTWWTQTDKITQQQTPAVGSVLVFPGPSSPGHVAYVAQVVSAKEIRVNHANWNRDTGKVDGSIWTNVRVQDVSGNWTKVKMEFGNKGALGSTPYATYGFVMPKPKLTLKSPGGLGVTCPTLTLNPNQTAACSATAYYTNGTNKPVAPSASWVSDKTNAAVSSGVVTSKGAASNTLVKITATYTEGTTQSASASTLTVAGLDGKFAATLGCVATWTGSKAMTGGTVYLYYSKSCGTNWATVVPTKTSSSVTATVTRSSTNTSFSSSGGNTPTAMVYSPTTTACASGKIGTVSLANAVCK